MSKEIFDLDLIQICLIVAGVSIAWLFGYVTGKKHQAQIEKNRRDWI